MTMKQFYIFLGVVIISMVLAAGFASAHEWYDPWCCNGKDCKTFEAHGATMVTDYAGKQFIVTVGGVDYFFPFGSSKIKASQDENYHVCILRSGMESRDLEGRCLYIPGMV